MSFRAEIEGDENFKRKIIALRNNMAAVLEEASNEGADVIKDQAARRAPGPHIETEVTKRSRSKVEVEIGPDVEHFYYIFFETGAQPHEITPLNKLALAFPGSEGEVVTRRVYHPGMPASPFLRPSMDENKDEAEEATGRRFLVEINKLTEG